MSPFRPDVPVLTKGAGPVGLAAAIKLARRGIGVQIVDPLVAPSHSAKAVGVQPRTRLIWAPPAHRYSWRGPAATWFTETLN